MSCGTATEQGPRTGSILQRCRYRCRSATLQSIFTCQSHAMPINSIDVCLGADCSGGQSCGAHGNRLPAGRERKDGAECWVAVASQGFSRQLLEDMPLQKDGRPLPPGKAAMAAMAPRMWGEVQDLLRGLGVGQPEQEPLFMQAGPVCLGAFFETVLAGSSSSRHML